MPPHPALRLVGIETRGTINGQAKGYGGMVDGLKMNAEERVKLVTPLPVAFIGDWEGRIIDPHK